MVCSNASGLHRIPLLVVGTSKKPSAFKHLNMKALAVSYNSQKNGWMSQDIFNSWFDYVFVQLFREHLKEIEISTEAMLFMDNSLTHPNF